MAPTVLHASMSIDGFVAGPDVSVEHPMGVGGERLHHWLLVPDGRRHPRHEPDASVKTAAVAAVLVRPRTLPLALPQ
ncbi:MAG: dihydrofolate reductase, partial [Ilumatobacteraceae bacterium]